MVNVKKKGNVGENRFANFMSSHGFKMHRNSSSGANMWKGDAHNNLDMNIEIKTVKKINLLECWRQTERDASLSRNQPVLAIHFDGMPVDSWLIVIHSEDWIAELKERRPDAIREENKPKNRELEWALTGLKNAINKVLTNIKE